MQEQSLQNSTPLGDNSLYFFKVKRIFAFMKTQPASFWLICLYLLFEYSRPQSIYPAIDIIPWTKLFLIGALIASFTDPHAKWVKSKANILIIIFSIVIFISSIFACFPEISKSNYDAYFPWVVIYFIITRIVSTRERYYVFLMVFILASAKIAIGTSRQWVARGFSFTTWGLMGPQGFFENSGELAILMLTLLPVILLFYLHRKDKLSLLEKGLLILSFVTPVLTILGASSRGAQIALCGQLLIFFRKKLFNFKWLIILAIVIIAGNKLLPEQQKSRFANMGEDNTSIQRKLYWKHGIEMIKQNPILGIGFFNFPTYYQLHFSEDLHFRHAELPHNIFIQVGTDAGFMGLIPFSLILLYTILTPLKYSRKRNPTDLVMLGMVGMGYGIFGFIIAGQFVTVTYYPFLWIGLSFIVAGKNILQKEDLVKNLAIIESQSTEFHSEKVE